MSKFRIVHSKQKYKEVTEGGLSSIGSLMLEYQRTSESIEDFRARIKGKLARTGIYSPTLTAVEKALESLGLTDFSIQEQFPAKFVVSINKTTRQITAEQVENEILKVKPAGVDFDIKTYYALPTESFEPFGETITVNILESEYFIIGESLFQENKKVLPVPSDYFILGESTFLDNKKVAP